MYGNEQFVTRYSRSPHRQPVGGPIRDRGDLIDEFLRLACLTYAASTDDESRRERARELLTEHPELATASIHTIAAVGDIGAARATLERDPMQARLEGGPHDWPPLLYLAYSRIDSTRPGHSTLETARLLLDHGADPSAGYLWEGGYPFTALTGALGRGEGDPPPHQHSLELARLLLDAGADPNDSQAIYNHAWTRGDEWLELLLEYGLGEGSGGPWFARLAPSHPTPAQLVEDALVWAAFYSNEERVRLLVRHVVDVDGRGTRHPIVEGHTAYQIAVLSGSTEIADILAAAGADTTLDSVETFLAACMRADRDMVEALLESDGSLVEQAAARKPHLIIRAADLGRADAVRLLVELGFDVNHRRRHTALHQAAHDGDLELVRLLIELGADPTIEDDSYHSTPRGWAEHGNRRDVAEYLASLS